MRSSSGSTVIGSVLAVAGLALMGVSSFSLYNTMAGSCSGGGCPFSSTEAEIRPALLEVTESSGCSGEKTACTEGEKVACTEAVALESACSEAQKSECAGKGACCEAAGCSDEMRAACAGESVETVANETAAKADCPLCPSAQKTVN